MNRDDLRPTRRFAVDWQRPNVARFGTLAGIAFVAAITGMASGETAPGQANASYVGDLVDGVREGQGTLIWPDGSRYDGDFRAGVRHGQGELRLPSGDTYTGGFQDDQMTGRGRFQWTNGDAYEGDFVAGDRTGEGGYVWRNGATYTGQVAGGVPHGQGVYRYENGTAYRGEFKNGARHGLGELAKGGVRYAGWFSDDERHGLGHQRARDGTVYKGHFALGRKNGPGIKLEPDGTMSFEVWNSGRLAAATDIVEVPRCALNIDDAAWMFDGDECINGVAHGRGAAVRLDGGAYVEEGRFVLGRLVAGASVSLTLPDGLGAWDHAD